MSTAALQINLHSSRPGSPWFANPRYMTHNAPSTFLSRAVLGMYCPDRGHFFGAQSPKKHRFQLLCVWQMPR
jgi:hypothetical protein